MERFVWHEEPKPKVAPKTAARTEMRGRLQARGEVAGGHKGGRNARTVRHAAAEFEKGQPDVAAAPQSRADQQHLLRPQQRTFKGS
jgi:hypothetical protein